MLSYSLLSHKLACPFSKDRTLTLTLRNPLLSSRLSVASWIHPSAFLSISEVSFSKQHLKDTQFTTFKQLLFQWMCHLLLFSICTDKNRNWEMSPVLKLARRFVKIYFSLCFSATKILTCLKDTLLIALPHVCCFQKYWARNTLPTLSKVTGLLSC